VNRKGLAGLVIAVPDGEPAYAPADRIARHQPLQAPLWRQRDQAVTACA
jgi:hypothetical protein